MNAQRDRDRVEAWKLKAKKWREKALSLEYKMQHQQPKRDMAHNVTVLNLKKDNMSLKQEVLTLNKKLHSIEVDSERQMLRKDGEIDRLKFALDDLKERYRDIKDDNKELRKATRMS